MLAMFSFPPQPSRIFAAIAVKSSLANSTFFSASRSSSSSLPGVFRSKLIATAMAEGKEQLALCIKTIACTGIRISEIKYFTVERVKSGKIEIYNKGKYRRIFLPKVLQRKLLSYCHNNQIAEGWIFVTKNGKLKDRSNIWREMKRLKEKAGVAESKIFPHNFRHLFARIYYKVTKDITGLADLLGHSSINVTRIYTATTETVFQKKLDKIVEQEILECTT